MSFVEESKINLNELICSVISGAQREEQEDVKTHGNGEEMMQFYLQEHNEQEVQQREEQEDVKTHGNGEEVIQSHL